MRSTDETPCSSRVRRSVWWSIFAIFTSLPCTASRCQPETDREGVARFSGNRQALALAPGSCRFTHNNGRQARTVMGSDMKQKNSIIGYFNLVVAIVAAAGLAAMSVPAGAQQAAVAIDNDDIGGVVSGPKGPEAGVWVIAETTDLPTKFAKIVVTDDQGRYLIPDLPRANYRVWVRGYGLVDSTKVESAPGKRVDLTAVVAPSEAAAAEYYPGMYWYSLLKIPDKSQFPGTGDQGNGIAEVMKTQHYWVDTLKNSCQSCHALGSKGVRRIPKELGTFENSTQAWTKRLQAGQASANMAVTLNRLGPKSLTLFADWTDRIAAGELPFAK